MFLFLILINAAGFREKMNKTGKLITSKPTKRKPVTTINLKFIDDMIAAESIYLKENLVVNPNPVRPLQYHKRTLHVLPDGVSHLQSLLDDLKIYSSDHQMRINDEKTKVILFNNAIKRDFMPQLVVEDDQL